MTELAAGAGLGALVGFLLGLSSASVVGGVIASLTALLASFLGLDGLRRDSATPAQTHGGVRIATFGVCTVIAVIVGIEARSHNWLGPTLKEQVETWRAAGASQSDAISYVAFGQLGLVPSGKIVAQPPKPPSTSPLLFSASASECDALSKERFGSSALRRDAFADAGGDWAQVAKAAQSLSADRSEQLLDAAYTLGCTEPQGQ
jgi:hypothetical protein